MDYDSFRIDPVIEQRLKEEKQVYENFKAFPDLYKRVRIDTIQSIKNQPELFESRLDKFIATREKTKCTANGMIMDAYWIIKI
ncbi:hypothetical protein YDYSY3_45280 [Paenibacillus chitinolyticus]|nr:hypothetical protein YDYSY3_45280 [Paenibacillus chitinolyticus]